MSSKYNKASFILILPVVLASIFMCSSTQAQNLYTPLDTADHALRDKAREVYKKTSTEYKETLLRGKKGKIKKALDEEIAGFNKSMLKKINAGDYCFEPLFLNYVHEVIDKLADKNPELKSHYQVLIAKDGSLNAYCLSDGTFVINMGLFYWLDDQDQLASIIAHEIGHKVLSHGKDAHVASVEDEFSRDTKRDIRDIRRSEHGKNEKAQQIIKEKLYARGVQSRQHELEADSIGYEFLRKTDYDKKSFIKALKIGQLYDTIKPTGLVDSVYEKIFQTPELPFNPEWLVQEDFSDYNYGQSDEILSEDSLASHPETKLRVDHLKRIFPELEQKGKEVKVDSTFRTLQKLAHFERIPNLYHHGELGRGIYLCMLRLQYKPDDEYHKIMLGKGLTGVYKARKTYTLNRHLETVSPEHQSESYQKFLNFIWNLKLDDLKAFAEAYDKS